MTKHVNLQGATEAAIRIVAVFGRCRAHNAQARPRHVVHNEQVGGKVLFSVQW